MVFGGILAVPLSRAGLARRATSRLARARAGGMQERTVSAQAAKMGERVALTTFFLSRQKASAPRSAPRGPCICKAEQHAI